MDDTTRSSTGPPVPFIEQRTFAGEFPVARRPGADVRPSNVTNLLTRRLAETTFTDMAMWLDYPMPPDKAGIVVAFTPHGAFVPHLLELIEWVEIGEERYRRIENLDGTWGCDKDGRHNVYLVVEVLPTMPRLPLMTRDVRLVFDGGR